MTTLENDVLSLTSHGERQVGSKGHRAAREYLMQRMEELRLEPYRGSSFELPYEAHSTRFTNLAGCILGDGKDRAPTLVGGHYDTCGAIPGADDNASALAIVLAAAEILKSVILHGDVIIAFFDAEEPPYFLLEHMGSIRFFKDQREGEISCAIILDLVGHDVPIGGFEDVIFITGMESHSSLEKVITSTPQDNRIRIVPTLNSYVGDMSDHHIFRVNDVPYLFLSCGRWEHYHMPTDTPEKLNYEKMAGISDYLARLIIRCDSAQFLESTPGYDTTATELLYINSIFSPLLLQFGVPELKSREDIDRLVRMMTATFGI
jgi:hypothetical protein